MKSCGSADRSANVDISFRIHRHDRSDDLGVVIEAFREEWPNGAIDQTSREGGFCRRTAFALEKAAGNLTSSVPFFCELNSEREEICASARFFCAAGSDENAGVAIADKYRTVGLFSHFSGFDGQRLAAHLTRYTMNHMTLLRVQLSPFRQTQRPEDVGKKTFGNKKRLTF